MAKNLRDLMKERGVSVRSAAELAGVSPSLIQDWSQGAQCSNAPALLKLCTALGADFQWMMTGVHSKKTNEGKSPSLAEVFNIENDPTFSGIFMIEAKRLKKREE